MLGLHGRRDRLIFLVGVNTGLRASDLLSLTVSRVKRQRQKQQKTGNTVDLLLPEALLQELESYIQDRCLTGEDKIFTTKNKQGSYFRETKELSYQALYKKFTQAGQKIGIRLTTHSLRKTFGRLFYESCKDLALTALALGQKDVNSTAHYIGLTRESVDNVRSKIGAIGF